MLRSGTAGEVVERFVAVVNDEVIFLSELEEFGKRYFEELRKNAPPSELQEKLNQARKEVLDQLIENKLLDQEIKKRKVEVADRDVDAAVEDILKQNRITLDELKMVLAKEGMTLTAYRDRLRDSIGKMRLVSREIKSKIVIKEEDLRKAYRTGSRSLRSPSRSGCSRFFSPFPARPPATGSRPSKKRPERFWSRRKRGRISRNWPKNTPRPRKERREAFSGSFKSKELMPELEEAAFPLKTGEISPLVRSPEGFHILRVMERRGGEPKPFAEVQGKIREEMMQAETEKKFQEWIKALKEKSYIEIKL